MPQLPGKELPNLVGAVDVAAGSADDFSREPRSGMRQSMAAAVRNHEDDLMVRLAYPPPGLDSGPIVRVAIGVLCDLRLAGGAREPADVSGGLLR
jgi:hypothetical protein